MRLLACLIIICSLPAETYYADPVNGKSTGNGSSSAPWPGLADLVANQTLSRLRGGDTLLLRSGDHGEVTISANNTELITIAGEPGANAQLARLSVDGSKWLISGLTISGSFAKKPYSGTMVGLGEQSPSSDLTVQNCFIYSALSHETWTAKEWMGAYSGITLGGRGTKLTARNNYILNTRFGINICSNDSLVEGNVVSEYSADALRMTRDGGTARCNVFKNAYVSDKDGDKNHDDLIQAFLYNKGTGTISNFTVTDNILIGNEDPKQPFAHVPQAIGMFDGPLINFKVSGNVIRTAHWHGVTLATAEGCTVTDNVCFNSGDGPKPWVRVTSPKTKTADSTPNVVKNNFAHEYQLPGVDATNQAGNAMVTADIYATRLNQLRAKIDKEFGRYHPVAGFARLGTEKGKGDEKPSALPKPKKR
ncbi:MAG: hypothetical protein AAB263_08020 [Planctomycetota bacterium]